MKHRKHIMFTKNELETIQRHIATTPKNGPMVSRGNGMASIVARHGKHSVEQKVAAMRHDTPLRELSREMQSESKRKSVWDHRGIWFLLGMIFAFSVALLI